MAENNLPLDVTAVKVFFTKKPLKWWNWRSPKVGVLKFFDKGVSLYSSGKKVEFWKNCKELEHLKMSGDFAKNWVYVSDEKGREYWFSEYRYFHGINAIFGGSENVFKMWSKYKKPLQIFVN